MVWLRDWWVSCPSDPISVVFITPGSLPVCLERDSPLLFDQWAIIWEPTPIVHMAQGAWIGSAVKNHDIKDCRVNPPQRMGLTLWLMSMYIRMLLIRHCLPVSWYFILWHDHVWFSPDMEASVLPLFCYGTYVCRLCRFSYRRYDVTLQWTCMGRHPLPPPPPYTHPHPQPGWIPADSIGLGPMVTWVLHAN